jgi:hypothetical protein
VVDARTGKAQGRIASPWLHVADARRQRDAVYLLKGTALGLHMDVTMVFISKPILVSARAPGPEKTIGSVLAQVAAVVAAGPSQWAPRLLLQVACATVRSPHKPHAVATTTYYVWHNPLFLRNGTFKALHPARYHTHPARVAITHQSGAQC